MTDHASSRATADPEQAGLVWIDAQHAIIVLWGDDEPVLEEIKSGVPPRRRAVGSVRRGPARPHGGGRVGGHGTEGRHRELLGQYFGEIAERLADLDVVEVSGRGLVHREFAELLVGLVEAGDGLPEVTTRTLERRPSDRQLAARFRRLVGEQLPRRVAGPYRPSEPGRDASGRLSRPTRADVRPNRRHLPEREHIEHEIEMMLAGEEDAERLFRR